MATSDNENTNAETGQSNQVVVPVQVGIQQIDNRLQNLEKVLTTARDIAESGLNVVGKYFEGKSKLEESRQLLEDGQHKRSLIVLAIVVGVVFVLCMTALLMGQTELVKYFIQSGLAVAAGTGLASFLRKNGNKKDETINIKIE